MPAGPAAACVERLRHRAGRFGLALALALSAAQHPHGQQRTAAPPLPRLDTTTEIPLALFKVPDGLEVTLWAGADLVRNPTNIDVDKDGRIWVAEGVRYRTHHARQPAGDRIVVLQDTNGDGRADTSHTFVQEPALIAPLGVAVIDNQDRRLAAARPDRLHRRGPQPPLRPGHRHARGAAHRLPGHQPRPLAALGHRRPRRQVALQLGQHGGAVHRPIRPHVHVVQQLSAGARRPVHVPARRRRSTPARAATTAMSTSAASRRA